MRKLRLTAGPSDHTIKEVSIVKLCSLVVFYIHHQTTLSHIVLLMFGVDEVTAMIAM